MKNRIFAILFGVGILASARAATLVNYNLESGIGTVTSSYASFITADNFTTVGFPADKGTQIMVNRKSNSGGVSHWVVGQDVTYNSAYKDGYLTLSLHAADGYAMNFTGFSMNILTTGGDNNSTGKWTILAVTGGNTYTLGSKSVGTSDTWTAFSINDFGSNDLTNIRDIEFRIQLGSNLTWTNSSMYLRSSAVSISGDVVPFQVPEPSIALLLTVGALALTVSVLRRGRR